MVTLAVLKRYGPGCTLIVKGQSSVVEQQPGQVRSNWFSPIACAGLIIGLLAGMYCSSPNTYQGMPWSDGMDTTRGIAYRSFKY